MLPRKENRRIIPRWRTSDSVAGSKEFAPLKLGPAVRGPGSEILDAQLAEFEQSPTMGIAAETISAAIIAGQRERAAEAAQFVLKNSIDASPLLLKSATAALALTSESAATNADPENAAIHRAKALLRINPINPAQWADLSRLQVSKGGPNALLRARRSMLTALSLAPNSRWILRSASRFFLHNNEADLAHKVLARHPRTRTDPWLMAAEIATAQTIGVTPISHRVAQSLIRAKSLPPAHRSELYAAFATAELETGAHKFARRLFATALENSTENAVAQAEWAARETGDKIEVLHAIRSVDGTFEATCAAEFNAGNLDNAFEAAKNWLNDEPFATPPLSMVCYLAGLRDDFRTMLEFTTAAIARHPAEAVHRHNYIFAAIATGEIFRNDRLLHDHILGFTMSRVRRAEVDLPHALANLGMFLYRIGDTESGRIAYKRSEQSARRSGDALLLANVGLYHAREAILQRAPWAVATLEEAWALYHISRRSSGASIQKYLSKLDLALRNDAAATAIRIQEGSAQQSMPAYLEWQKSELRHTALPQIRLALLE